MACAFVRNLDRQLRLFGQRARAASRPKADCMASEWAGAYPSAEIPTMRMTRPRRNLETASLNCYHLISMPPNQRIKHLPVF